jgi:hypothetical protein
MFIFFSIYVKVDVYFYFTQNIWYLPLPHINVHLEHALLYKQICEREMRNTPFILEILWFATK